MPKGSNWGKVNRIEQVCRERGLDDGAIALAKVNALMKIVVFEDENPGMSFEEIAINLVDSDVYNPDNVSQLVDCMVHKEIVKVVKSAVESFEDALAS